MTVPSEQIFIVDHMLGSLARWLRMLGYDSRYEKDLADNEIIEIAEREERIILTRDKDLAKSSHGFFVSETSLDEQLLAVKEAFGLKFHPDGIRCSVCNGRLIEVDPREIEDDVPQKPLESCSKFWRCGDCEKIYWDGTHWDRILGKFKELKLVEDEEI